MPHLIPRLKQLARQRNLAVVKKGDGHYHITGGPFLVNYYPFTKNKTAYIAGTFKSIKNVSLQRAVDLCFEIPKSQGDNKRRSNYKSTRNRLFKNGITTCHWCGKPLTPETSTLEHIIPLSRNGLDNDNNRTLACAKCNHSRGSNMPEIEEL